MSEYNWLSPIEFQVMGDAKKILEFDLFSEKYKFPQIDYDKLRNYV